MQSDEVVEAVANLMVECLPDALEETERGSLLATAEAIITAHDTALKRQVETLREAVGKAVAFLDSAPLESGYCCCGDRVDAHNMGSGHSPVDDLRYYASNTADDLRAALAATEPQ